MLDDLFSSVFDNLFVFSPGSRRLSRLIKKGETVTARIDGVRITESGENGSSHYYRLLLGDGTALGVRQMLRPRSDLARLGAEVVIRRRKDRAVIDWPQTLERAGENGRLASIVGSPMRRPPATGIDDRQLNRKRLERGRRAEAELLAARATVVMGMPTENVDLHLRVADEEAIAKRVWVPPYALYLLEPGTRLPVAADGRGVVVDWAAAAERDYAAQA